jgi:hypothetical protein
VFLGDINTGTWTPVWGSLECETVKYGRESVGFGPENECTGEGQQQL